MLLYHFTPVVHIQKIISLGLLYLVESDLGLMKRFAAPSCVWLTTDPDPTGKHGLNLCHAEKEAIRITVEIPDDDVVIWSDWATENGMKSNWRRSMYESGGGRKATDTWRMVFRPVVAAEWTKIENLQTGEVYDFSDAGRIYHQDFFEFTQDYVPAAVENMAKRLTRGFAPCVTEEDVHSHLVSRFARQTACGDSAKREYGAWLSETGFTAYVFDMVYVSLIIVGGFCMGTVKKPFRDEERAVINLRAVA